MSLFLGKIHYWLYDKILWFEDLEIEIARWAKEENLPIEKWTMDIDQKYGELTGGRPLEDIIDTSNIHGWLQGKILVVEGRQAYLVTQILNENAQYKDSLIKLFQTQGKADALKYSEVELNTPEEVYNALNDFILEGMPCDRVNEVVHSDNEEIRWKRTTCLHSEHWSSVDGNVAIFYELREAWIQAFVSALKGSFTYEKVSDDTQKILR